MQRLKLDDTNLSAIYSPAGDSKSLVILGHGAGAGLGHTHMKALSDALNNVAVSTLRFNFPFMEAGRRRVDSINVCIESIFHAVATVRRLCPESKIFVGGHSFGGRMSTHYAVEYPKTADGIILFSFPLHSSKKPAITRASHLNKITTPIFFLSGDRDNLADPDLLRSVTDPIANAKLHWLETADHSYQTLKRSRQSSENVYIEAARMVSYWITNL